MKNLSQVCLKNITYSSCTCSESLNEFGQVEFSDDKPSAVEVEGQQEGKHNY